MTVLAGFPERIFCGQFLIGQLFIYPLTVNCLMEGTDFSEQETRKSYSCAALSSGNWRTRSTIAFS